MATVQHLLDNSTALYKQLQIYSDSAEERRRARWRAVILLQRRARGLLVRRHVARLHRAALLIQTAFRAHVARRLYRRRLREAVFALYRRYYDRAATRIQAAWRGFRSRRRLFCYATYRRWLSTVSDMNAERAAEAAQYRERSRAEGLSALEAEARRWLAFVLFKLHHLLRTASCAGVYSQRATTELSEFEQLLTSIKYTDYVRRLRRKYAEYVRTSRPHFRNERLFPVIGDGADYWYLSLADMYELTSVPPRAPDTRAHPTHHAPLHPRPFLWRRAAPPPPKFAGRGPYTAPRAAAAGAPDARFHLYVKHYRPALELFNYVDFHVNVLLRRRCELEKM